MTYKIGDIVAIRTYDDCIEAGYRPSGMSEDFDDIPLSYVHAMYTNFGDKLAKITSINNFLYVSIVLLETEKPPSVGGRTYNWSSEMLKPAILKTPSGNILNLEAL